MMVPCMRLSSLYIYEGLGACNHIFVRRKIVSICLIHDLQIIIGQFYYCANIHLSIISDLYKKYFKILIFECIKILIILKNLKVKK